MKSRLEKIYRENTVYGIYAFCLAVIIGQAFFPEFLKGILPYFIPVVITVLFVEFVSFRNKSLAILKKVNNQIENNLEFRNDILQKIGKIENKVTNNYRHELFLSREDADKYAILRIKNARRIRHIHFSSFSTLKDTDSDERRSLYTALDNFIRNPTCTYDRIICDTDSQQVKNWVEKDLQEYRNYKFGISILNQAYVHEFRFIGIILIDDSEVMLWGGSGPNPTNERVVLHGSEIVDFFSRYFDQLNRYALPINLNAKGFVDWVKYSR